MSVLHFECRLGMAAVQGRPEPWTAQVAAWIWDRRQRPARHDRSMAGRSCGGRLEILVYRLLSAGLSSPDPNQEAKMFYRVDATVQGPHGTIEILATLQFQARKIDEAEAIADAWAARHEVSEACILRLVKSEMILSQRGVQVARWSRSSVGPLRYDQADV